MEYLFIFLLGISIGSFLNVLIDRLSKNQSITGRSHCDFCRKKLQWIDLIPILSFIFLAGKCRYCRKKLSFYYPLVELLTGVIFVLVFNFRFLFDNWRFIGNWLLIIGLLCSLIVIFFADLKYQIIPDQMQIVFLIFAVMLNLLAHRSFSEVGFQHPLNEIPNHIRDNVLAGILIMLPILFLWFVTRGRGMGFGDVKLSFTMGFLLGIKSGFLALYFSFIIGALVGLFLIVLRKKRLKSKIAFGPFMVLGILIMIIGNKQILEMIKNIYGF